MIGPIYVSCIVQKILMSTSHQFFQSSFHFHHSYPNLLITNRKQRSLTPYSKPRRAYTVNIASRADLGQWQFTSAKILLSTEHAWNKEGVAGSQSWLPYHLPEGYSGVNGLQRQRQNESNQTLGNSPRRWRRARAYIDITHILELKHTTLSISWSTLSLWDLLCFKLNPYRTHFFYLFSLYTRLKYFFLFLNLIIYIEIWHLGFL